MRTFKDYKPETRDLLNRLLAAGFTIKSGNNGGEADYPFTNLEQFLAESTACDEAHIFVRPPGEARTLFIYLVLGNEPGYLVCDHQVHPRLNPLVDAFGDAWDGKEQPMSSE